MSLEIGNQIIKLINIDGIIFRNENHEKNFFKIDNDLRISKNEYFKYKLIHPIVHFLRQETIIKNIQPIFCSDIYEMYCIKGEHDILMNYEENVSVISDYLVKEVVKPK